MVVLEIEKFNVKENVNICLKLMFTDKTWEQAVLISRNDKIWEIRLVSIFATVWGNQILKSNRRIMNWVMKLQCRNFPATHLQNFEIWQDFSKVRLFWDTIAVFVMRVSSYELKNLLSSISFSKCKAEKKNYWSKFLRLFEFRYLQFVVHSSIVFE